MLRCPSCLGVLLVKQRLVLVLDDGNGFRRMGACNIRGDTPSLDPQPQTWGELWEILLRCGVDASRNLRKESRSSLLEGTLHDLGKQLETMT